MDPIDPGHSEPLLMQRLLSGVCGVQRHIVDTNRDRKCQIPVRTVVIFSNKSASFP
jgi:hypothetical protein